MPGDGIIPIQFTPSGTLPLANGLTKFAIEIPVCAIEDNAVGATPSPGDLPINWVIRGGLQNSSYDLGIGVAGPPATKDSTGGAIILGVGNIKATDLIDIEILTPGGWN